MRRLSWTRRDMEPMGLCNCFVLLPESDEERIELRNAFEDVGVANSRAFNQSGINGRLSMEEDLTWAADGGVRANVAVQGQPVPIEVWFWLVECNDGTGRRFAWWSTGRDSSQSQPLP